MKIRLVLIGLWLFCQACNILVGLRFLYAVMTSTARAWNILLSYDRLGNVAANGDGRETISQRASRVRDEGGRWGCVLCRWLDEIDPGHCDKAKEI